MKEQKLTRFTRPCRRDFLHLTSLNWLQLPPFVELEINTGRIKQEKKIITLNLKQNAKMLQICNNVQKHYRFIVYISLYTKHKPLWMIINLFIFIIMNNTDCRYTILNCFFITEFKFVDENFLVRSGLFFWLMKFFSSNLCWLQQEFSKYGRILPDLCRSPTSYLLSSLTNSLYRQLILTMTVHYCNEVQEKFPSLDQYPN